MPVTLDNCLDQGKMFARWPLDGWQNGGGVVIAQHLQQKERQFLHRARFAFASILARRNLFPDLQQITIAGHGAGADFVQRYAAVGQAPDILDKQQICRYVLSRPTPSSYLYFTLHRGRKAKQARASVIGRTPRNARPIIALSLWPR